MQNIISKLLPADIGAEYVKSVLTSAGASIFPLKLQPVYALVPENTSNAQLVNFTQGGILAAMPRISQGHAQVQSVPTTIDAASSVVSKELLLYQRPTLWIHELLLSEEEIMLKNLPYMIIGGNTFFVYRGKLDNAHISEIIRYSLLSWHFLALITDGLEKFVCVDDLFFSAKLILAGAYDGESFLYTRAPVGLKLQSKFPLKPK